DRLIPGRVPEAHRAVAGPHGQVVSVGLEGPPRIPPPSVAPRHAEGSHLRSRGDVPNRHHAGTRDRGDLPAVRAEAGGAADSVGSPGGVLEAAGFPAGVRVPEARRAVPGRGDGPPAVGAEGDVVDEAGVPAEYAIPLELLQVPQPHRRVL